MVEMEQRPVDGRHHPSQRIDHRTCVQTPRGCSTMRTSRRLRRLVERVRTNACEASASSFSVGSSRGPLRIVPKGQAWAKRKKPRATRGYVATMQRRAGIECDRRCTRASSMHVCIPFRSHSSWDRQRLDGDDVRIVSFVGFDRRWILRDRFHVSTPLFRPSHVVRWNDTQAWTVLSMRAIF